MGDVTALMMDTITEKSGHTITPMAVSVCITPAAPSPLPIPYPVIGSVSEGVGDPPMRTKINGSKIATTGSVIKTCHGNEPGTLKEVVSLNTAGPCFIIIGAPIVLCELGMMGFTGSACISNKAPTPGAGANASGAGGAGGAGGGAGGGGSPNANDGSQPNAANGGGGGGDGTNDGATADPAAAGERYCPDENKKAPPPFIDSIEKNDLRNSFSLSGNDEKGKKAAFAAMFGAPGGATKEKGQAFWSGGQTGMDAATKKAGKTIQEDEGGAKVLNDMNERDKAKAKALGRDLTPAEKELPEWSAKPGSKAVSNEQLWKTISRRSAENSKGSVDAFVVGKANATSIFSTVELPTLLHNKDVNEIKFHDPEKPYDKNAKVPTWKRDAEGCWVGDAVPPGPKPKEPPTPPKYPQVPGFKLHPTKGIDRPKPPK